MAGAVRSPESGALDIQPAHSYVHDMYTTMNRNKLSLSLSRPLSLFLCRCVCVLKKAVGFGGKWLGEWWWQWNKRQHEHLVGNKHKLALPGEVSCLCITAGPLWLHSVRGLVQDSLSN